MWSKTEAEHQRPEDNTTERKYEKVGEGQRHVTRGICYKYFKSFLLNNKRAVECKYEKVFFIEATYTLFHE